MTKLLVLVAFVFSGACGSEADVPAIPCDSPSECGDEGWAHCVAGACHIYDLSDGYATATVNLSFSRERMAYAGYVHFFLATMPDGSTLSCDDILQGVVDVESVLLNPLLVNPETGLRGKYLVFHWTGGTFFPNNLVQFIRPGEAAVAVAVGYSQANGEGALTSIGCTDSIDDGPIRLDEGGSVSFTINLQDVDF